MTRAWWRKPTPPRRRYGTCFRTKTDALNAFRAANWKTIEAWGGMDRKESPAEFDAINHKYGLKGRRAARDLATAMWAALPTREPPYCLDDIDLDALNDTSPAHEAGAFRLPDWAYENRYAAEQEAYYREQGLGNARNVCRRLTFDQEITDTDVTIDVYRGIKLVGGARAEFSNGHLRLDLIEVDASIQRCGVATRLYEILAQVACDTGRKLASDTMRSDASEGFWVKQARKGRARCVPGAGERIRDDFTSDTKNPWPCEYYEMKSSCPRDLSGGNRRA